MHKLTGIRLKNSLLNLRNYATGLWKVRFDVLWFTAL